MTVAKAVLRVTALGVPQRELLQKAVEVTDLASTCPVPRRGWPLQVTHCWGYLSVSRLFCGSHWMATALLTYS